MSTNIVQAATTAARGDNGVAVLRVEKWNEELTDTIQFSHVYLMVGACYGACWGIDKARKKPNIICISFTIEIVSSYQLSSVLL